MQIESSSLKILFVGPYPPPFGGISSLIKSLVEGLKDKNIEDAYVLYFGTENRTKKVDGATVYERSVRRNIWQLLNPVNLLLIPSLLRVYSTYKLSIKDYLEIFIKTVLTNNIVKKTRHQHNKFLSK
jgi:hypothetical protein